MPPPRKTPPSKKPPDPAYVQLLERFNYMPEAVTDVTTQYVLNDILKKDKRTARRQGLANSTFPVACHPEMSSRCRASSSALEPILLILTMPWFTVHTGHIRTWTVLHRFKYPCVFKQLNMRMLVLVQPGELEGCKRICPDEPAYADVCECRIAEHDRAYQHRNLQNYTDGSAHILYAHADTWINLFAFRSRVDKLGNTSLSPRMGLQGTSYTSTPSRCIAQGPALDSHRQWFWHLDAKPQCIAANAKMGSDVLGEAGAAKWQRAPSCCYGWVDIAYIPMAAHATFRLAAHAFWRVQLEVAMPTIFHALDVTSITPWKKFDCLGGCCTHVSWNSVGPHTLCAHRTNLELATLRGMPPRLDIAEVKFSAYF